MAVRGLEGPHHPHHPPPALVHKMTMTHCVKTNTPSLYTLLRDPWSEIAVAACMWGWRVTLVLWSPSSGMSVTSSSSSEACRSVMFFTLACTST